MKKRILLGLIFLSTGAAASNACLIDGRTVFQKEPCPIQEAKNLTDDIRLYRQNKEQKVMRSEAEESSRSDNNGLDYSNLNRGHDELNETSRLMMKSLDKANRAIKRISRGH